MTNKKLIYAERGVKFTVGPDRQSVTILKQQAGKTAKLVVPTAVLLNFVEAFEQRKRALIEKARKV
jgi:hypothetical protein